MQPLPRLVVDGSFCAVDVITDYVLVRALQQDGIEELPNLIGGDVGLDQVCHHVPVIDGPGGAVRAEGVLSADLDPADEVGQGFVPELGEPPAVELSPCHVLW